MFDAFIDPLRTRTPSGGRMDAASACSVLDQLIKLVGKPDCENDPLLGSLHAAMSARFETMVKETEGHVSMMAATFLEVPQYRLPGAEEAVRQIGERLKGQVEALEPVRADLNNEVRATYARLFHANGGLGGTGLGAMAGRGADGAPGKLILPDGCKNLDEAADQFLAALAPEDLLAFDEGLQRDITRKFRGLGNVCLKPLAKGPLFREMLLNKAREFLDERLDHSDPATAFFRSRTENGSAQPLLGEAFEEAEPDLAPNVYPRPYEMVVLCAPPGPDGDRLKELAKVVVPETEFATAPLPDDICFYREYPQLKLTDLPQLGEYAREAYQQMMASATPSHARVDVPWQPPGT